MTYKETIEFLYSRLPVFHRIGKAAYKANLDNTIALDDHLGNPHRKFRSIHIAGTNGKGSVSHMLASVLQEAGCKTALYTSPHLKDYRERIKINGEMIPEKEVVRFVEENFEIIERIKPSFFEMSVAMAFSWFEHERIDVAVIETGLGGRLDSTNIIDPLLSVITNISFDHMDLLGNTLQKIAFEKAGIIKKGVPVIIGETCADTMDVFVEKATIEGSPIHFADRLFLCTMGDHDLIKGTRSYEITNLKSGKVMNGTSSLGGDYQEKNIPVVVAAAELLRGEFNIEQVNIIKGIENVITSTGLLGRWQILGTRPLTICDTGHNKEGLRFVISQLLRIPAKNLHMVIGFVNDKEIGDVLPLFPGKAKYYFTRASIPRALDENVLMHKGIEAGLTGEAFSDVASALDAARKNAGADDLIFIGGSTFVVAEVV